MLEGIADANATVMIIWSPRMPQHLHQEIADCE
jgi:hypothetical protein